MKSTKNNIANKTTTEILNGSLKLRPDLLYISDIKWKYLIRSALYGKNILMVGPTGSGKTLVCKTLAEVLNKEGFYFNMGATQDARSSLIGNTNFDKDTGTVFNESTFVRAIKTAGCVILLDEISRAHHDAWNIIMTVLDPLQRYLRLDEKRDSEVIKVADGVTFVATANIGNEYTATRVMDRALMNRFPVKIEMEPLSKDDELTLMINKFNVDKSNVDQIKTLTSVCAIAGHTREQIKIEDGKLTNFISTRSVCEMTELVVDGFSLVEIAEVLIYPEFSNDGGIESERTYVKQLVQKYIPTSITDPLMGSDKFTDSDGSPPF
jgi:nitric oxide reductase NorQ protein